MKKNKTISKKHFRYLHNKDIKNPLYFIATYCNCETDIESLRQGVLAFFKNGCTMSKDFVYGNPDNNVHYQQQLIKLIEIAYVLRHSNFNFKLDRDHLHYRNTAFVFDNHINDSGFNFHFRNLKSSYINTFFVDFFSFSTLDEWRSTLDLILSCSYSTSGSYDTISDLGSMIIPLHDYIESLIEAIFLINEIKAQAHPDNALLQRLGKNKCNIL